MATCPDDRLRTGLLELADKTIEKTKGAAGGLRGAGETLRRIRSAGKGPRRFRQGHRTGAEESGDCVGKPGDFYVEQGNGSQAIADLSKAVELRPDDGGFWYHRALARLAAGQANEHRDDCVEMLQRLAQSGTPDNADWAAWTCALGPDTVTDWSKPLTLAEKAAKSDPKSHQLREHLGRGPLPRRAVRGSPRAPHRRPILWSRNPTRGITSSPAYAWFFLAMAHHRLGHTEEAKQWLDKAVAWTDKTTTEADQGKADLPWNRRLTLKLLRDEATTLLGVTPPDCRASTRAAAKEKEESK